MGTLYLDRKDMTLRLDGGRLVITEPTRIPQGIPLKLLDRVVIQGRVMLDSALLGSLVEQGIAVVCLSGRHSRRTALILGKAHADARRRLAQYHLQKCDHLRLLLSRALVGGKLHAQCRTLTTALTLRPDCRKPLGDALAQIDRLLPALDAADSEGAMLEGNSGLDVVRGLEGAAAATYFSALTNVFPPSLNFTGRNRRPPRDPVNACLSLGYTLLHFEAVTACHSAGLDPLLGFFHQPAYGRESLACDLIEPLRPRLDAWVWNLFRNRALRAEYFAEDKGACLMNKAGRQIFYTAYESFVPPLRRYLRHQSYLLARELVALIPQDMELSNL